MTGKDADGEKKEPTTAKKITNAVEAASRTWPAAGGDTNLYDVYWLAQRMHEGLGVTLPTVLQPKDRGVAAFECVETNLLRGLPDRGLIRETPIAEVARRIVALHTALTGMLPFSAEQNLVVSLYAWHGCIHMGKLLRCGYLTPSGLVPYTPQQRLEGFAHVRGEWERQDAVGNPWVRYGVSLARLMEKGRKGNNFDYEAHENWIPKGTPYWEE